MSEKRRLLSAIIDAPEDDAPRLVYSDWLEENGDARDLARAELIRLQVASAKLEERDPARPPMILRERELLHLHGEAWRNESPKDVGASDFRRGFPEQASMSLAQFLRIGTGDEAPITSLQLSEVDDYRALAACPHLQRLAKLSISNPRPDGVRVLLPALQNLRSISLQSINATADEMLALEWPDSLINIDLGNGSFPLPTGIRWPRRLESLSVRYVGLNTADAGSLAASLADRPLKRLDAGYNGFGNEGVARLLESRRLAEGLEELRLGRNGLEVEGIRHLTQCRHLRRLRHLDLGVSHAGLPAMRLLAEAEQLSNLERLDLRFDFDEIKDEGVGVMVRSPVLANLGWFELSSNGITAEGAKLIADAPWRIWHLDLYQNNIGDAGVRALAASPHLRGLQMLNLYRNEASGEALADLMQSENMRNLLDLSLKSNAMGRAVLEGMVAGPLHPFASISADKARKTPARQAAQDKFGDRLKMG